MQADFQGPPGNRGKAWKFDSVKPINGVGRRRLTDSGCPGAAGAMERGGKAREGGRLSSPALWNRACNGKGGGHSV